MDKEMYIELEKLLLYEDNPRLSHAFSEQESIFNMISDQRERLVALAESIVKHGLNPLGRIGVFPSKEYEGYYCVGEGNRRICVLKLLENPYLCKDANESIFKKFLQLSTQFNGISRINVEVFPDFDSMKGWIENIHMGEQEGRGVVRWNTIQKQRFDKQVKGKNLFLDFFEWIIEKGILSRDEINSVTQTNWQRILRKKYFDFLCVKIENDQFVVDDEKINTFAKRIRAIQSGLMGKTVSIVYDSSKLEAFFNDICYGLYQCNLDELTVSNFGNQFEESIELTSSDDYDKSKNDDFKEKDDKANKNNFTKRKDDYSNRKTIIPNSFNIVSSSPKINKIIRELKRLHVDDYPNACAALLRLVFELSSKHYLEKKTGEEQTEIQFEQVVKRAANKLRNEGLLSDNRHSSLLKDVDIMRRMFNDNMHSVNDFPSIESLKAFFTSHHSFVEECLKV